MKAQVGNFDDPILTKLPITEGIKLAMKFRPFFLLCAESF
jgi:hypothetical protein